MCPFPWVLSPSIMWKRKRFISLYLYAFIACVEVVCNCCCCQSRWRCAAGIVMPLCNFVSAKLVSEKNIYIFPMSHTHTEGKCLRKVCMKYSLPCRLKSINPQSNFSPRAWCSQNTSTLPLLYSCFFPRTPLLPSAFPWAVLYFPHPSGSQHC